MVQVLADKHQLIFRLTLPIIIINGKPLAAQMENVTALTFVKPQNSLSPEHVSG